MSANDNQNLSESDRKRIREEMRYALTVLSETKLDKQPTGYFDKFLKFMSSGFILLLIGSLITSILVPKFQRKYERNKQRTALMQECFSQFLLYGNSAWREYYSIFPLIHDFEISKEKYIKQLDKISSIKLERYDAFAQIEAISIIYRGSDEQQKSEVENRLHIYAVKVNQISAMIDTWLRNLYCAPNKCLSRVDATIDSSFNAVDSFNEIKRAMFDLQSYESQVSSLMVKHFKSLE